MSREEMEVRVAEIMDILDESSYESEEEENILRDECEALIDLLNSEEYREIPRSEMDKYYDEVAKQLDKMPEDFVMWYLLRNRFIKKYESEIVPYAGCKTKEGVAMSYVLSERVRVLREMEEELASELW